MVDKVSVTRVEYEEKVNLRKLVKLALNKNIKYKVLTKRPDLDDIINRFHQDLEKKLLSYLNNINFDELNELIAKSKNKFKTAQYIALSILMNQCSILQNEYSLQLNEQDKVIIEEFMKIEFIKETDDSYSECDKLENIQENNSLNYSHYQSNYIDYMFDYPMI